MLKALYDYAITNQLTLPPGFVKKTIKAYICISASGQFLDIKMAGKEPVCCPDIGSLANGTDKSNVLAEKRKVLFPKERNAKNIFFRDTLRACGKEVSAVLACLNVLEDDRMVNMINQEADRRKIKSEDKISFCVDGQSILEIPEVIDWWKTFRKQFIIQDEANQTLCLITGQPTVPMATVPPVNGLSVVGGHQRGDALICFDKTAFCSYGLKQAANAPVSEEAFFSVKAALDHLLAAAPVLAGMKLIHWYDKPVKQTDDCIFALFDGFSENLEEDSLSTNGENSIAAQIQVNNLISSVSSGKEMPQLANFYYILMLSGVNGRVMIRRYEYGNYAELQKNLNIWFRDLELTNETGTGLVKQCKLTSRLIKLLTRQTADSKPFERLAKELSGIIPAILTAILTDTPLPDATASRSIAYIRSQMMDTDQNQNSPPVPDGIACQWLKVWLIRRNRIKRQEESLMVYYNPNHPNPAYHCGALVAAYAEIQKRAMPEINADIVQRYYAAASQTPALVIGQLARLSNYHLSKINNRWLARWYEGQLNQISIAIGDSIPNTLNLEQQAYFTLGYRQFCAELMKNRARNSEVHTQDQEQEE